MSTRWVQLRQATNQYAIRQFLELDGVRLGIEARYITAKGGWSIWILSPAGDRVVGPLALSPGIDLLTPYHYLDHVPPGSLFVQSTSRDAPTRESLDVTARLIYREAEE